MVFHFNPVLEMCKLIPILPKKLFLNVTWKVKKKNISERTPYTPGATMQIKILLFFPKTRIYPNRNWFH